MTPQEIRALIQRMIDAQAEVVYPSTDQEFVLSLAMWALDAKAVLEVWKHSYEMGRAPYDKGDNPADKILKGLPKYPGEEER